MYYDIQNITDIKTVVCKYSPTYADIKNDRDWMFDAFSSMQEHHMRWFAEGRLDLSSERKLILHLDTFSTFYSKNKLQYDIITRDCYHCMMCGQAKKRNDFHIDHILPKSKFPSSHPWNLQLLCNKCNLEKSDEILDEIIPILLDGARTRTNKYYDSDEQLIMILSTWGDIVYNTMAISNIENIINGIIDDKIPWRDFIK